jgi:hypothetical protein
LLDGDGDGSGGGVLLVGGALGVSLLCVGLLGDGVLGDELGVLLGEVPGEGVLCWDGLRTGVV